MAPRTFEIDRLIDTDQGRRREALRERTERAVVVTVRRMALGMRDPVAGRDLIVLVVGVVFGSVSRMGRNQPRVVRAPVGVLVVDVVMIAVVDGLTVIGTNLDRL